MSYSRPHLPFPRTSCELPRPSAAARLFEGTGKMNQSFRRCRGAALGFVFGISALNVVACSSNTQSDGTLGGGGLSSLGGSAGTSGGVSAPAAGGNGAP